MIHSAPTLTKTPRCGLVIGTFSAIPYVHLQLEAARRLYFDVPILIHDDASRKGATLEALARSYGAEFTTYPVRHRHHLGDLSIYPVALEWSSRRNFDLLLKVSRRWVWQVDWRPDLLRLEAETDAPTYSNYTESYAFGFRTECVAFKVATWASSAFLEDVQAKIDERRHIFVENYIHNWAIKFSEHGSDKWKEWRDRHPVLEERKGYAPWEFMGNCRQTKHPSRLWHDSDSPSEYAALAEKWGLAYTERDFRDPNGGEGAGQSA